MCDVLSFERHTLGILNTNVEFVTGNGFNHAVRHGVVNSSTCSDFNHTCSHTAGGAVERLTCVEFHCVSPFVCDRDAHIFVLCFSVRQVHFEPLYVAYATFKSICPIKRSRLFTKIVKVSGFKHFCTQLYLSVCLKSQVNLFLFHTYKRRSISRPFFTLLSTNRVRLRFCLTGYGSVKRYSSISIAVDVREIEFERRVLLLIKRGEIHHVPNCSSSAILCHRRSPREVFSIEFSLTRVVTNRQ